MEGEGADPKSLLSQGTPGSCKKTEDALGVLEGKYNLKAGIPSQNMIEQLHGCGDDSLTVDEVPRRTLSSGELSGQFLPMGNRKEQMDGKEQSDVSSGLYEEGGDPGLGVVRMSVSPQQEVLINSRSSELWPINPQNLQLPVLSSLDPEVPTEVREGSRSGIIRNGNHFPVQPHGEKEAQAGSGENGGSVGGDVYLLCSRSNEGGPHGSSQLATVGPEDQECGLPPLQEEFCRQSDHHASSNEDYYDYIEEFLGEGTLVNIDAARTYVDLQSGTIKTSVEVSAEDDGVAVKHEVEWVTRFLPNRKQK